MKNWLLSNCVQNIIAFQFPIKNLELSQTVDQLDLSAGFTSLVFEPELQENQF